MAEHDEQEPIAIVGAACRLPGEVSSLGTLWDMISNERTGHCKVPSNRWDADLLHHPDPDRKGSMAVKHGYFLQQDLSLFDAPFFSTTAKEAAAMDPMKRLLLEVSYESIENAGIPLEDLMNSRTGCYVGCMTNDYELMSTNDFQDIGYSAATGTSVAMTSNRVSWFFGLRGPSLTLDTACSSSLYALHLACQSLKLKEADSALVAGVNLMIYPKTMQQFSAIHMLSPEGISHSFDDRANGYGRGEGIGALVVKRLSDAIRDGDTIRAVVRQTGANADGKTPSITQPSSDAQADLIRSTYASAGLDLTSTQYFESHGTGTPVGDPIELTAISSTIGAARKDAGLGPLYFGSVKPNVGHTEGCSGLAGIFKAILCLEKGTLVPTYDVKNINPRLKLDEWNLALPPHTMKWPVPGKRRISVNSFGFGGANAHVILDDAHHYMSERGLIGNHNTIVHDSDREDSESGISMGTNTPTSDYDERRDNKQIFVFSTKDQAGLKRIASTYSQSFAKPPSSLKEDQKFLNNLAYTLSSRRTHHDFRTFAIASSLSEMSEQLEKPLPKTKRSSRLDKNLVFVFTGQGAQWPAMGTQLLSYPVFKESMKLSQTYLEAHGCDWNVFEELEKTQTSRIALPEFSQTLCTVLQVALVDLLREWQVTPRAVVGHSSGEIGAAYAASYINHSDAVKIAYVRGISSASITREGAMMAAGLSRSDAQEYLEKVEKNSAVVACINSPTSVTLSGDVESIDTLEKLIQADDKFARKLKVKTAYHSPHMQSVAEDYFKRMGQISIQSGSEETVMYSSLTGSLVSPEQLNAQYWVDNMCNPVEFSSAVTALLSHTSQPAAGRSKGAATRWGGFMELGPHSALQGPVQQITSATTNQTAKDAPYVAMILRNKDAVDTALTAAGQLWTFGIEVDLQAVNGVSEQASLGRLKPLADLPTYPWNHKSFWHEPSSVKATRFPKSPRTDLLGVPENLQNQLEPRWRNFLRVSENPWIEDHKITGTILYPGAGMLVMALEGALQSADPARKIHGFRFRDVNFERGMVVTADGDTALETCLSLLPHKTIPGQFQFTVYSVDSSLAWTKHCGGQVSLEYTASDSEIEAGESDPAWASYSKDYKSLCAATVTEDLDIDEFYDHLESKGMDYGPLFRNVVSLTSVPSEQACHGVVTIPDTRSIMPAEFEYPHVMHPATMDAIFHLVLSVVNDGKPTEEAAVPYHLEDMFVAADQPQGAGSNFSGYSRLASKNRDGTEVVGDLFVSEEAWSSPKILLKGLALRQVSASSTAASASMNKVSDLSKCARIEWREDLDFIRSVDDIEKLRDSETGPAKPLRSWLKRLAHKQRVSRVLMVLDEESDRSVHIEQSVQDLIGKQPGFDEVTVTATSSSRVQTLQTTWSGKYSELKSWDTSNSEGFPYPEATYDLIVVIGSTAVETNQEPLSALNKALAKQGHLVICPSEGAEQGIISSLEHLKLAVQTYTSEFTVASTPVSSVSDERTPSEIHLLLPNEPSSELTTLSNELFSQYSSTGIDVYTTTLTPDNAFALSGKHVVSLLEVDAPLVYSWSEEQFTAFKYIVSTAQYLFWITRGSLLEQWSRSVEYAPAQGLLRVMRNEYPLTVLPHLDLSASFDGTKTESAQRIFAVWKKTLAEAAEMEFAEQDGSIHIPRAVADVGFDGELQLANGTAKPVRYQLRDSTKAMKLDSVMEDGDFLWIEDDSVAKTLQPNEVEIAVDFVGLSTSLDKDDVVMAPKLSREAVGIVTRCGDNVKSLATGQLVVASGTEACRTHIRQIEDLVAPVPAGLRPEEAAVLPRAFVTARYTLAEIAGLGKGRSVLIHQAASPIGQAAIQISREVGAEVFALVGSLEEKQVLVDHYGIASERIFDSSRETFVSFIEQTTGGRGVDVVLCSHSSRSVSRSLDVLNESGYFFDLSTSHTSATPMSLPASKRNASFFRVDMDRVQQTKPRLVEKLFQQTFQESIVAIRPSGLYSVSNTVQAVDRLKSQEPGAVVLSIDAAASVSTLPPSSKPLDLDNGGTYVLAGGLGVLGLEIANMMVEYGAKHLVFISRSGGSKNEKDLESFRSRGVRADAFKGDVNSPDSIAEVFAKIRKENLTIKGVVQCAMVLEDTIFENMTHEKWSRAFQPKTRGSRNLLANLSSDDSPWFILLSSITGVIGNTAQANYASGNSFEDAIAQNARKYQGIAATSIDVGLVADSSHFTADGGFGELKEYLHRYSHGWVGLQCTHAELHVALQACMRGRTANGEEVPAQVVLGLSQGIVRSQGSTGFDRDRKFDLRVSDAESGADGEVSKGINVADKLAGAATMAEASAAIEQTFKMQIAAAFGVGEEEIDGQRPLPELGVDSLKAVEIRNRAIKEMQSEISVFELLSSTPLTEIAAKIAAKSALVKVEG